MMMLSTVNGRATSFAIIKVDHGEELAAKAECQLEQVLGKRPSGSYCLG